MSGNRPESSGLPDETRLLLSRAQEGNQEAYDRLFTRYYPRVLRIVRSRMGAALREHEEPEDIVQQTFVEAVRDLDSFESRSDAGLIHWFARIVENQIRRRAKHHGAQKRDHRREVVLRRIRDGLESGALELEPTANDTAIVDRVARLEQEEILDECLAQLSQDYREAIVMRDFAGGSWEWIANELGRPSAEAARQLHSRARLALIRAARPRLG